MNQWFRPASLVADPDLAMKITPDDPGWAHTGLYVAEFTDAQTRRYETGDCEWIVLPLAGGGARVRVVDSAGEAATYQLTGRADVFAGPSDLVYVPRDAVVEVTSDGGGRIAFPFAKAAGAFPARKLEAADVQVELRGGGRCSRQVHNFGTPGVLEADSIIACEVITPAGNWSSYPPHKHDTDRAGEEAALEEIYYFELRTEPGGPAGAQPFGYQRVYGTDDRPIDVLEEVRTGDVVLVPHGWHGPAMAPAGYDMYYLNVMAGPGPERAWLICDDPAHAWIRATWDDQQVDSRLPLASA